MLNLPIRLTLNLCVSQLTDLFSSTLVQAFMDEGIQPVRLVLTIDCYKLEDSTLSITLTPGQFFGKIDNITVKVEKEIFNDELEEGDLVKIAEMTLDKGHMKVSDLYRCALHVAGDFIKFSLKGEYGK